MKNITTRRIYNLATDVFIDVPIDTIVYTITVTSQWKIIVHEVRAGDLIENVAWTCRTDAVLDTRHSIRKHREATGE